MTGATFWLEFAVRVFASGLIVLTVAWAAARLGPAIGGVLAGLPIVLAPGFFFLIAEADANFVSEMAAGTLFSMIATQGFLLAYIWATPRAGPLLALGMAALTWVLIALPLNTVAHGLVVGVAGFALTTVGAWLIGRRFVSTDLPAMAPPAGAKLVFRGIAAGLLVGSVTVASPLLGPSLAGAMLGFPIGFCVILLSLDLDYGSAVAGRTAHSGLLGVVSLATFSAVLSYGAGQVSAWTGFLAALSASVLVTLVLTRYMSAPKGKRT
jgi:hypothetical protein